MAATTNHIADDLRRKIASGEISAGDKLPTYREAQERYGATENHVRRAYAQLQEEGLVLGVRRRGTVVLDPSTERIVRSRTVYRDEYGYYFDRAGQAFHPVVSPTIEQVNAGRDIAHRLHIEPDASAVARERVLGKSGSKTTRPMPLQVATSYLPGWLVDELPVLTEADTGPGGIYDRIEEWANGPLTWDEAVTAAVANATVAKQLRLPRGAPLLRVLRTARLPDGRPAELTDVRMDSSRFEIAARLSRHTSAKWPTEPATSRNVPS